MFFPEIAFRVRFMQTISPEIAFRVRFIVAFSNLVINSQHDMRIKRLKINIIIENEVWRCDKTNPERKDGKIGNGKMDPERDSETLSNIPKKNRQIRKNVVQFLVTEAGPLLLCMLYFELKRRRFCNE